MGGYAGKHYTQRPESEEIEGTHPSKSTWGEFAPTLTQYKVFQGLKVCVLENVMTGIVMTGIVLTGIDEFLKNSGQSKIYLLDGLLDRSQSFSDVERESLALKSIDTLKDAFSKQAGCTWEEAVIEFQSMRMRKFTE